MSRRTLMLAAVVLAACASQQDGRDERLISPLSYSPAAGGVGCGARLSELVHRRKNIALAEVDKRTGATKYINTADSEIFSQATYRVVGGRVVEIAVSTTEIGLYMPLYEKYLDEELGAPAEVSTYPDPPRMRWRFGTVDVTLGEEDGVTVLRTTCPFEAGR